MIRILDLGGAEKYTVESVVILRLKMVKSSATRLYISVIFADDRVAGAALIGQSSSMMFLVHMLHQNQGKQLPVH